MLCRGEVLHDTTTVVTAVVVSWRISCIREAERSIEPWCCIYPRTLLSNILEQIVERVRGKITF